MSEPTTPSRKEPPLEIRTLCLRLVAITPAMALAALNDRDEFGRLLNADVPSDWPPVDLADVQPLFVEKLTAAPAEVGWWGWYVIANPGHGSPVSNDHAVLIGSCGCCKFGKGGCPIFGYGLLPAFFRRGFATEAAVALGDWVMAQPGIDRMEATTFERHEASLKILARCGFVCLGVSLDDATAAESDRQGRGKLLLFERVRTR